MLNFILHLPNAKLNLFKRMSELNFDMKENDTKWLVLPPIEYETLLAP